MMVPGESVTEKERGVIEFIRKYDTEEMSNNIAIKMVLLYLCEDNQSQQWKRCLESLRLSLWMLFSLSPKFSR